MSTTWLFPWIHYRTQELLALFCICADVAVTVLSVVFNVLQYMNRYCYMYTSYITMYIQYYDVIFDVFSLLIA